MTPPTSISIAPGPSQPGRWRLIPPIEKFPGFVAFTQTPTGKVAIVVIFGLGLRSFFNDLWAPFLIVALLGLIAFFPKHRRTLLPFGTFLLTAVETRSLYFLGVVAFGLLLFWFARKWPDSWFGRRPVVFLLGGYTLDLLVVSAIPRGSSSFSTAWAVTGVVGSYIWFIGYALLDRTASLQKDFPLEAGTFHPFWGSSNTPFPKGAAYLRRIEARDAQQLAIVQLKGLKLLTWALMLNVFRSLWMLFFHTHFRIPLASEALAMSVQRTPLPWHVCWESQLLSFFEYLLDISIFGHKIIACCRMAGFNALRNTYRPLSSPTIMEFFNRFYYYFKELLVEFFFYPMFFLCFKRRPRLRVVAATFAAAGFGNVFYHFTRDTSIISSVGFVKACVNFQVFAFYCLVLATALSISQVRRRGVPHAGFLRGRLFPAMWVILFYSVLDVFGSTQRNYPLTEHFRFLGYLFGIHS
jgi:hypothetical protein